MTENAALLRAEQIPLDLGARHALGRDDFQIGKSNRAAIGWLDKWPAWGGAPILLLHGPAASGKTHLAAVWQAMSGAYPIQPDWLISENADSLCALGEALVIDGIDPWLGERRAEETLFHLYNLLKEEQKTMLITSRMAFTYSEFIVPDLASRFRAAPSVGIDPPDDMLLASVLIKLFSDHQLRVSHDVISYILPRMERSFSAARDIVTNADQKALAEKRGISIPLMRSVLTEIADNC